MVGPKLLGCLLITFSNRSAQTEALNPACQTQQLTHPNTILYIQKVLALLCGVQLERK